jgi:hypothetical protein
MQILAAEHFLWHGCFEIFERVKSQLTSVWSKHVGPMEGVAGSYLVFQNHLISSQKISEHLGQPLWAGKEMSCCHFTNGDFGPQYCSWGGVRGNVNSFQLASEKKRQLKADESGWIWLHWLHSKTLSTQQTKPVMQGESSAVSPAVNWVHYLTGFTRW